jgi:hypothetical protein
MKRDYRNAYNALKKLGVPLYQRSDMENFGISAEDENSYLWCDYYEGYRMDDWIFGVNPAICDTLSKYNLHAEWINPAELGIYKS